MPIQKKYARPSIVAFTETIPNSTDVANGSLNFVYLTDEGRSPLEITYNRLETKKRMINGRMRSRYIADKRTFSLTWTNLPSRSKNGTGTEFYITEAKTNNQFVAGEGMLNWYEDHGGQFYMLLSYDKLYNFETTTNTLDATSYSHLQQINEIVPVYFSGFNFSVEKRGPKHDLWSLTMTLEEA
jgi:hypothetical protein